MLDYRLKLSSSPARILPQDHSSPYFRVMPIIVALRGPSKLYNAPVACSFLIKLFYIIPVYNSKQMLLLFPSSLHYLALKMQCYQALCAPLQIPCSLFIPICHIHRLSGVCHLCLNHRTRRPSPLLSPS